MVRESVVAATVGVCLKGIVCAVDIPGTSVGARGFVVFIEDKAVVVLRVVMHAGGTGGGLDVGDKIVVAGLEVILGVCLAGVFDNL